MDFEKSPEGLDEQSFGALKTFDAFPKTKASYTSTTSRGGQWTLGLIILSVLLTLTELREWYTGKESHHFSVERGVGHELQLNLDIIVAMPCADLHVNVQDAAMDRIVAGDLLTRDPTNYALWTNTKKKQTMYQGLHDRSKDRKREEEEDQHVAHVLGHMRDNPSRKFAKTPRLSRGMNANACRIYGSLEGNKVQGDFHITARGHGYMEFGAPHHLDHSQFNFSHHINEMSFGPHYPGLLNPLDKTTSSTESTFYKYQYFISIVPTVFTKRKVSTASGILDPAAIPQPATLDMQPDAKRDKDGMVRHHANPNQGRDSKSIFTNQYAATSQSHEITPNMIPGVFFKYDIEPILLIVSESRSSFLALLVRLVNVISGVIVGGGWAFQITEWAYDVWGKRRSRSASNYMGIGHRSNGSLDAKHGID